MKKLLLSLLGVVIALPALARDFSYTHEGQTITYTVIDEDAKTCQTKPGTINFEPGNNVSGAIVLPEHPKDGDIEYTLTAIGSYSFIGCKNLTSIDIPNSVTEIFMYAFANCSGINSLTMPDAIALIDANAFNGCTGLTSIRIPDAVKEIGYCAFIHCSGLTAVYLPELTKWIAVDKGGGRQQLFPETASFFMGDAKVDLDNLFEGNYAIPESVTKIGAYTFYLCEKLTSVAIPESVTKIGDYAFCNCSGLKSIELPESITDIGRSAFSYCSGITSVRIPSSIKYIGGEAFFSGCYNLETVYLPDITTWISADKSTRMFPTTAQLYMNGEKIDLKTMFSGDYTIPESVTQIGDYTFYGCEGLNTVKIPNSVTRIGNGAFYSCKGLTSVTIPSSVTETGSDLFYYCVNLTSVELPNSLTRISWSMFSGCTSLTSIKLPDTITEIGCRAFYNCTSLSSIDIPNSVTKIESMAFCYCYELTDVVIGNSVSLIDIYAFEETNALKNITLKATVPPTSFDNAFSSGAYETAILHIPANSADAYRDCSPWNKFTHIETTDIEDRLESVASDTGHSATEVYNLAGIKVANSIDHLPKGTYVVRQGAKVTKVRI